MDDTQVMNFGPFRVELGESRLWRGDRLIPVTRKSFAVLRVLLERPGRLVTKQELFASVWQGAAVSDSALSRCIRELRLALGDDAATPSFVETAHGLGFRFIGKVGSGGPRSAPLLVGRSRELSLLGDALVAARAGARQVVFVTGEPGIGKTTLIDAFLAQCAADGEVWIGEGRCIEQYGTSEAYLPIREALERLTRRIGAERMRTVLARFAPAWLAQLSWLIEPGRGDTANPRGDGTTPQQMLREFAQALETLATEGPIILWLEDLHWSDYATLDLLSFVAGRRETARLLIVATYRPADLAAGHAPLRALKEALQLRGQCREVPLDGLGVDAIRSYVGERFGDMTAGDVSDFARDLHRRTDGNPLFMTALLDDVPRRDASITQLDPAMPATLRSLIEQQFERLPGDEQRLLEVAAVAGATFSSASVAAGLQLGAAETEAACAQLARRGRFLRSGEAVAWPDGTLAAGFEFRHALYWQAIYDRIPVGRRGDLHRRVAEREEQAYGDQAGAIASELAMHYEAAHDHVRAVRHLERAGKNALVRHAYLAGIDLLRHALRLTAFLPTEARARQELELLLPLGAALIAAQGYAAEEAKLAYERALDVGRAIATPAQLVRILRGLWNVAVIRSDMPQAQALANELDARARASGDAAQLLDAHAKLGQTAVQRAEFAVARRHLDQALALYQGAEQRDRLQDAPRVAAYAAWALWYLGFADQALARGQEALALARRIANPHSSAFALGFVAWVHQLRGESAPSLALAEEQEALSTEHGLGYWRAWSGYLKGIVATQRGDHAAGLAQMRDSLTQYRALGANAGVPFFLCHLADAAMRAGRAGEAAPLLEEAGLLTARDGNDIFEADLYRLNGKLRLVMSDDAAAVAAAEAWLARAIETARRQEARALLLRATIDRAALWHRLGRTAEAEVALRAVLADFSEGHGTADLEAARDLLAILSG